ncbi:MAG: hypothetical protein ABSG25_15185, partial [Bryobacteraceae bacterium]
MPKTILEEKLYREMEDNVTYGKTKYARYLESAKSAMPNMSFYQEANIVKCLKNMEDALKSDPQFGGPEAVEKYIREDSTRPSDINAFIHYAFDMVTAMIPANPIEEFATTQAIEKRVGEIFFMDIIESSTKGSTFTAGNAYMSSLYGPEYAADSYSDNRVLNETAYTGDGSTLNYLTYNLQWLPVLATFLSVTYTIGATQFTSYDDGNGNIVDPVNLAYGKINYTTGNVELWFRSGKAP